MSNTFAVLCANVLYLLSIPIEKNPKIKPYISSRNFLYLYYYNAKFYNIFDQNQIILYIHYYFYVKIFLIQG